MGLEKEWTTIFAQPEESSIRGEILLTTLPIISNEWSVAFKFKLTRADHMVGVDMQNFLRINLGASSMRFHFKQRCKQFEHNLPELGEWTHAQVDQHKVAEEDDLFLFAISIGGIHVYSQILQHCQDFANVRVWRESGPFKDIVIKTNLQSLATQ